MATSRTRDGLTLSYTYDSANRLLDPHRQSRGALIVTFAAVLDSASLQNGVAVERFTGSEWVALPAQELLIGYENDASELKVLVKEGWLRESSYRVRLTSSLRDKQGRGLSQAHIFNFRIAVRGSSSDFSKTFAVDYESAVAAVDTLGGRFPGGQNSLFQGLWTDPVTGISYARARWYDGRNAGWLSEDPLQDVDSPNLYEFVGWGPQSGVDPLGEDGYERKFGPPVKWQMPVSTQKGVALVTSENTRGQ